MSEQKWAEVINQCHKSPLGPFCLLCVRGQNGMLMRSKPQGCVLQCGLSGEFILPQKDWIPSILYSCSLRISLLNSNSTERRRV